MVNYPFLFKIVLYSFKHQLNSVYSLEVSGDVGNAGGQLGDGVADVNGRGNETWHDFGGYLATYLVEEDVVAIAVAVEVVEEVVGADLKVVGQTVEVPKVGELDIKFNEANQRLVGDGEFDAAVTANDNAFETGRGDVGGVVKVAEADDLHVGVANGAARVGAVVFEKKDRGEFAAGNHVQPVLDAEADDPVEVVLGIERQFGCTVIGFDEDGREGIPEHRVFVGDEKYRPVLGDDTLKFIAATEGAFMAVIDNGHRFGAANLGVKNEVVLP